MPHLLPQLFSVGQLPPTVPDVPFSCHTGTPRRGGVSGPEILPEDVLRFLSRTRTAVDCRVARLSVRLGPPENSLYDIHLKIPQVVVLNWTLPYSYVTLLRRRRRW